MKAKKRGAGRPQGLRLAVRKTYKMFIDGKFPRTESGRYYVVGAEVDGGRNVCRGTRKDIKAAVIAARAATERWARASAYNRGQIVYRIAEMLEGRSAQFIDELCYQGYERAAASREVTLAVDRLVYFAGWADKFQQISGTVNPVASPHFNFSIPEPMGVVACVAPRHPALLGAVSLIAPAIVGGNCLVMVASEEAPLAAVTFAEVLLTSDLPAGVVNIVTGQRAELLPTVASHLDINAVVHLDLSDSDRAALETAAAGNVKRVIDWSDTEEAISGERGLSLITDLQEIKTVWHPVAV